MKFLDEHLKDENSDKKAADYIVPLTGKAYLYNAQNVTLKKGDIIIPADYGDGVPDDKKNKKVYVYIGDTDLPLTSDFLSNENFTTLEHKLQDEKQNIQHHFQCHLLYKHHLQLIYHTYLFQNHLILMKEFV